MGAQDSEGPRTSLAVALRLALSRFGVAAYGAVFRASASVGRGAAAYNIGYRLFGWCCGRLLVQRLFFRQSVTQIERFVADTQLPVGSLSRFTQQSVLANAWRNWWMAILEPSTNAQFAQVVSVAGFDEFQGLYDRGKGVLLVQQHSLFADLFWLLLERRGFSNRAAVGKAIVELRARQSDPTPLAKRMVLTQQYLHAQRTLATGGIVRIAPDGYQGRGGVTHCFYHKVREFRTGFADLALSSGAPVLAVDVTMQARGGFRVEFGPVLDSGTSAMPKAQRLTSLVQQYIAFHAERWRMAPWDIPWDRMYRYFHGVLETDSAEPTARATTR